MMMTVNGVSRTPRANWPAMPHAQDFRYRSNNDYDTISPDFLPPTLKPQDGVRESQKLRKKEKKWSIGGFFRRKKRPSDTDSSSPLEDDEEKKGFLERRRSSRKKKNRGSKDVTDSFEHVRMNLPAKHVDVVKEISNDRLVGRSQEEPLWTRQNESHIRGSSVSLENAGKKGGRIQVKARVEACRDRLRAESSSDEGESSRNSSALRLKGEDSAGSKDGSLSRRSRAARTERYKKRLSRDEESLRDLSVGSASRISRSDEKISNKTKVSEKTPTSNRWTAKVVYYESSDYETKYTAKTKSATPSPLQSPKTKPKNALHFTASAPPATNYVTYPPSHGRDGVVGSHQELRSQHFPTGVAHGLNKPKYKHADMTPPRLPKSNSELINIAPPYINQSTTNCSPWGRDVLNRKSASYDCNVNHLHYGSQISQPHPLNENVLVVQFPISKPVQRVESNSKKPSNSPQHFLKLQNPPPPPPRDPNRKIISAMNGYHEHSPRPMSYAFEDKSQESMKNSSYPEFGSSVSAFQRVPKTTVSNFHNVSAISINNRCSSDQQIASNINPIKMSPNMPRRPSSAQQELTMRNYTPKDESFTSTPPSEFSRIPFHYTDQQPRSRKPIHIPFSEQKPPNEILSNDSKVLEKPPVQQSPRARPTGVQTATEFWKQRDLESAQKVHISEGSPKLIQRHFMNINHSNDRTDKPLEKLKNKSKPKLAPLMIPSRAGIEYSGSISNQSSPREIGSPRSYIGRPSVHNEIGIPVFDNMVSISKRDFHPMSMLEEKIETSEQGSSPYRKINSLSNFDRCDNFVSDGEERNIISSSNLEEALNELEAIYKSLRTGEDKNVENVTNGRFLSDNNRLDPANWNAWVQSRGFESDSSLNYSRSSLESVDSIDSPIKRKPRTKKTTAVPDKVTDDMAYRKLNKKDKPPHQEQEVLSQAGSFLLVSPTLSPPPFKETFKESIPSPPAKNEPNITLDDVVYRSIKHVNSTLKVLDPQPPFGIPLGPVTPAPNSDYLHVTPKEVYRPTFKPRKTPDVVTDDLAFRNLRKDGNKEPLFSPEDTTAIDLPSIKKKRAVRSLSANLLSIMQKEPVPFKNNNNLIYNNNSLHNDLEKSQSFTDLINNLNRSGSNSKGFYGENIKINELSSRSNLNGDDSSSTPRASRQFFNKSSSPSIATSTETITESKINPSSTEQKSTDYKTSSRNSSPRKSLTPERRHTTDSINPFKRSGESPLKHIPIKLEPLKIDFIDQPEPKLPDYQNSLTPDSHSFTNQRIKKDNNSSNYNKVDSDFLSELAREAVEASEQLSKDLYDLELDGNVKLLSFQQHDIENIPPKVEKTESKSTKEVSASTVSVKPLTIGKVIPHRPVKLTTFKITEDDKLENNQTEVTGEPIEIECSQSMTDLLTELTKSLDFDFDSSKETEDQSSSAKEETEDEKHFLTPPIEDEYDQEESNGQEVFPATEQEVFSEAVEPQDTEDKYFSSLEEEPGRNLSSPELSLLRTLSELTPPESEERLEIASTLNNSFPLVISDENLDHGDQSPPSESQSSQQHQHSTNDNPSVSRRDNSSVSCFSRVQTHSRYSSDSITPGCSSSRDPDCSMDCSNMTDEGTKSAVVSVSNVLDCGTVMLACMACLHQLAGLDFLTILGLILAMASLILFLVL